MLGYWRFARKRFDVIFSVIADAQARGLAWLFYYTILVPFGLIAQATSDPLRRQLPTNASFWLERAPIPGDLDSARRQG